MITMRHQIPLNKWDFSIEALNYRTAVMLPHTWNVDDAVQHYRGAAAYETTVQPDEFLKGKKAYLSFGAVYHHATVYVNDTLVGEHGRSGHTPFRFDVTDFLIIGGKNRIRVIADNTKQEHMLPHMGDFDWADDGGITRRATLEFLEPDGIEFLHVTEDLTEIEDGYCSGTLTLDTAFLDGNPHSGTVKVIDYADNRIVLQKEAADIKNEITLCFEHLKTWDASRPNLYRIALETEHDYYEIRTGLRKIEVCGEKILLNNQEVFLKGCEWMPGSHPDYGMAEPLYHSIKCLSQLKNSGCVFTRFHWQQDSSLFDWCDENGLLVQEEIPYWGYPKEATSLQLEIAKQQADEMVFFHKNHPSIIFWGVGNELNGASEETIDYVEQMSAYFKAKDGRRLVNYVSNTVSLDKNVDNDDATLHGDVAMWNDYLGFWEPCDDVENHALRTAAKCKGMPLVVSEFGLCEPHFTGGDERRSEILKERLKLYSRIDNLKGYVWFSLNDYRTHVGEQGEGKLRQRVHGSTDLYGNEKPSYALLRSMQ